MLVEGVELTASGARSAASDLAGQVTVVADAPSAHRIDTAELPRFEEAAPLGFGRIPG